MQGDGGGGFSGMASCSVPLLADGGGRSCGSKFFSVPPCHMIGVPGKGVAVLAPASGVTVRLRPG